MINIVKGDCSRGAYYAAGGKAKNDRVADAIVSRMLTNANAKAFHDSLIGEAACDAIMTRVEAMKVLTSVARTKIEDKEDYKLIPILPAIKQLAQMEGWDSATKHEHSGPEGGPIETTSDIELARKLAFLLTKGEQSE
jgi:hypothetical protein